MSHSGGRPATDILQSFHSRLNPHPAIDTDTQTGMHPGRKNHVFSKKHGTELFVIS